MRAVGDTTKKNKGPTSAEVARARRAVERAMNVDVTGQPYHEDGRRMTELYPGLYDAWARLSGDPDIYVPQWLRGGTPTGLKTNPLGCKYLPKS